MARFHDQHYIESTRLPTWDYADPGQYFITICTKDRLPYPGRVCDGEMILSLAGVIVDEEWRRTAELRANLYLDAWAVMPNHVHGIIVIEDTDPGSVEDGREKKTLQRSVSTSEGSATSDSWKPGVLGSIINQFKGACTKRIRREVDPSFGWQSRFYEHIIRDDRSLQRIRDYIDGNPALWHTDQLYIDDNAP